MLTCKGCGASYDDAAPFCPYCRRVNPGFVLNSKGEVQLPVRHTDQLQCPNCGGFKVDTTKTESIGQDSKSVGGVRGLLLGLLFMFVLLPIMVFFAVPVITFPISSSIWKWYQKLLENQRGYVEQAKRYWYRCELCGFAWQWRTDEPYPEVQARPDLIAKAEAARWICPQCGSPNEGIRRCRVCNSPHP